MSDYPIAKLEDYGYKEHKLWKKSWKIFNKVAMAFVLVMLYLSIIVIAVQSFNSSSDISSFESITLRWYAEMFSHRALRTAIQNTFIVSLTATLLATVLGTFIAVGVYSLDKKKRQRIMLLNNIPLLNADIVTGISLMLVFSLLLPLFPYLFGPTTMILAHLFFTLPYVILSVLPKLRETDPNLMDAALDLGVKSYKALLKVVIPAIKAGIFAGMLIAFTMSIDDLVDRYYTTGNGLEN
jgi:spermidine/putrescine transport system permease protein